MSPKARICSRSVAELIEMYECGEIVVGATEGISAYNQSKTLIDILHHMIDYSFRFDTILMVEISASKYEMVRLSDADYLIKVARFKRGLS
ncbi:MAG: hypothetical protein ACRCX2_21715, partial [Paraclostridium sp.]